MSSRDRPCAIRVAPDEQVGAWPGHHHAGVSQVGDLAQVGHQIRVDAPHAVVGHQDDRHLVAVRQHPESVQQPAKCVIDLTDRALDGRRRRTGIVSGAVDSREVEGDQVGAGVGWQRQPGHYLVDTLTVRPAGIVWGPERRTHTANCGFRAHEEHRRRHHALGLGRDPDRFAPVPRTVLNHSGVPVVVCLAAHRVEEAVAHDAVVLRVETGGDGVVARERQGRVDGDQGVGTPTGVGHVVEAGRVVSRQVVVAEAVERDQHHIRLVERLGRVGSTGAPGRADQLRCGGCAGSRRWCGRRGLVDMHPAARQRASEREQQRRGAQSVTRRTRSGRHLP